MKIRINKFPVTLTPQSSLGRAVRQAVDIIHRADDSDPFAAARYVTHTRQGCADTDPATIARIGEKKLKSRRESVLADYRKNMIALGFKPTE